MATPSRHTRYHDWTPSPQTRIYTRSSREPRDEYTQFAKGSPRSRPTPIIIAPGQPSPLLKSPPANGQISDDLKEAPAVPEIVDIVDSNAWPRRGLASQKPPSKRIPSPSVGSQCSTHQSEISYGILDYYMQDSSPLTSPKHPPTPRIETPVLGPAIEEFDFGLDITPSFMKSTEQGRPPCVQQDATSGAERQPGEGSKADPIKSLRPKPEVKRSYRLFPAVQQTISSSIPTPAGEPQTPPTSSGGPNLAFTASHPQPNASYRPRKESISGSIRSRKDSLTSFSGTRRIPMRILSNSTATSKGKSSASNSPSNASPPSDSRWSDETITSPLVATTPGPRTSFASLLRAENSARYPACFFEDDEEDDDEAAPLRRKFAWKRRGKVREGGGGLRPGRFDQRRTFGGRLSRVLLCTGCCG